MSKAKKEAEKFLRAIEFEAAPLSKNKGRHIYDPICRRLTDKDRRHSGHKMYFCEDEEGYVTQFDTYDAWAEHRDGMRNIFAIKKVSKIHPNMFWCDEDRYWDLRKEIKRMKKKERIRKIMKYKEKLKKFNKFRQGFSYESFVSA
jgi:hypothetical protein